MQFLFNILVAKTMMMVMLLIQGLGSRRNFAETRKSDHTQRSMDQRSKMARRRGSDAGQSRRK